MLRKTSNNIKLGAKAHIINLCLNLDFIRPVLALCLLFKHGKWSIVDPAVVHCVYDIENAERYVMIVKDQVRNKSLKCDKEGILSHI